MYFQYSSGWRTFEPRTNAYNHDNIWVELRRDPSRYLGRLEVRVDLGNGMWAKNSFDKGDINLGSESQTKNYLATMTMAEPRQALTRAYVREPLASSEGLRGAGTLHWDVSQLPPR